MKRGLSLFVAMIAGATLAQMSAQAAPLLVKPVVESTVAKTTFFVDRKKAKHAHLKKAPHKKHKKH